MRCHNLKLLADIFSWGRKISDEVLFTEDGLFYINNTHSCAIIVKWNKRMWDWANKPTFPIVVDGRFIHAFVKKHELGIQQFVIGEVQQNLLVIKIGDDDTFIASNANDIKYFQEHYQNIQEILPLFFLTRVDPTILASFPFFKIPKGVKEAFFGKHPAENGPILVKLVFEAYEVTGIFCGRGKEDEEEVNA